MPTPLVAPTPTLGGTKDSVLLSELNTVREAASALYAALQNMTVHPRDYIEQETAYQQSVVQWSDALAQVRALEDQVLAAKFALVQKMGR